MPPCLYISYVHPLLVNALYIHTYTQYVHVKWSQRAMSQCITTCIVIICTTQLQSITGTRLRVLDSSIERIALKTFSVKMLFLNQDVKKLFLKVTECHHRYYCAVDKRFISWSKQCHGAE